MGNTRIVRMEGLGSEIAAGICAAMLRCADIA
jgi:hypothetical protein